MTTSSLEQKKQQINESYIDFTNDQIRMLESTKTDEEFDAMMYAFVEQQNIQWYISEGMSEGEAKAKARMNRKKSGG